MTSALTLPAPGLSAADVLARAQSAAAKIDTPVKAKAMAAARDFEGIFLNSMFQSMEASTATARSAARVAAACGGQC